MYGEWCTVTNFSGDISIEMKFDQILVQLITNILT